MVQIWEGNTKETMRRRQRLAQKRSGLIASWRRLRWPFDPARAFAVLMAVLILGAVVANNRPAKTGIASDAMLTPVTIPVTVSRGDTLWLLAQRYGDPTADIQERVDRIAQANRLSIDRPLQPGQHILVRVANPTVLAQLKTHAVYASR